MLQLTDKIEILQRLFEEVKTCAFAFWELSSDFVIISNEFKSV